MCCCDGCDAFDACVGSDGCVGCHGCAGCDGCVDWDDCYVCDTCFRCEGCDDCDYCDGRFMCDNSDNSYCCDDYYGLKCETVLVWMAVSVLKLVMTMMDVIVVIVFKALLAEACAGCDVSDGDGSHACDSDG